MNHPRDREHTAEDVSLNLNAALYQMPLIPSQVWLTQQHIHNPRHIQSLKRHRWVAAHREAFVRTEHGNTDADITALPLADNLLSNMEIQACRNFAFRSDRVNIKIICQMYHIFRVITGTLIICSLQSQCRHIF